MAAGVTEYRARAAECRSLAGRTPPGEQQDQFLQMARAWEALAEERDRQMRRAREQARAAARVREDQQRED
ncbi:MAG TPA: hypothetical protein VHL98_15435 [Microvirga sp.]|jgi:hypothetical protein|nr:hypothetical protein [Microvirga sp.]